MIIPNIWENKIDGNQTTSQLGIVIIAKKKFYPLVDDNPQHMLDSLIPHIKTHQPRDTEGEKKGQDSHQPTGL